MSGNFTQKFLDMMLELVRANPSLKITDRLLYAQLISFRLGNASIPFENVEKYFRNWITTFKPNPLIDVYRDHTNPFVCHFVSKKDLPTDKGTSKIYGPMDATHIKDGVLELFEFLSLENIAHISKVLSSVRNDNVIIRVSSIEDVNKIVGVDGKLTDTEYNFYEYDLGNGETITLKYYAGNKATVIASYDKKKLANKNVDLSDLNSLKKKVSSGITYDQFKKEIGGVDGTLIEKSESSNKYSIQYAFRQGGCL